ncbi:MAG: DUF1801 domain-containing protein [Crocinitomicaceae bacterium]|nr:DUF1801 domain-containing protein [Crocinitomicaceae bacterium]
MNNKVKEYLNQIPDERKKAFEELRDAIINNLPKGFEETFQYGMISYVVPHSIYPNGYHVSTDQALPFVSIANQKNFIALYHMGIYAEPSILNWFVNEYPKYCKRKLDMGKSCIRFKKPDDIPYNLIKELLSKISCNTWIEIYESNIKSK